MFKNFKNLKQFNQPRYWLFTVAAVWTASAYAVAFQRATCGHFWKSACLKSGWEGYAYVITFGWLKDYQDAFAGIATLAAAIIAFLAIRWQVRSEFRIRSIERIHRLRDIMQLIAVEFDIANGHLRNDKAIWNGNDFLVLDQLAVDIVSYDANMLELGKRARTLISETAATNTQVAALMALAAHEAFRQTGEEATRPVTRHAHFDATEIAKALAGRDKTLIRDLRHYFKWA